MVLKSQWDEETVKCRAEASPALPWGVLLEAFTQTSTPKPREVTHMIKEFVGKPNNLSSNPGTQMVGGENRFLQGIL